jgi:glycosyltransferase involved in cell wall biosynthesis
MRILITNEHCALVGGVESYLASAIPALLARGHEIMFLHASDAQPGRSTVTSAAPRTPSVRAGTADALAQVAAWRPEVIYAHGIVDVNLEATLAAQYPTVFFAHSYYGACISGTKRLAFPAIKPCTRALGPGCLAHYHVRRCGGLSPLTMISQYRLQSRRRALLGRCEKVIVISRHMKHEYERQGLAPDHVVLLPYAVDTAPEAPPPARRPQTDRILFVGRLTTLKGGRALIEATAVAARTLGRPLRVVVAGDGDERPHLDELARRLGVPIEFAGWVGAAQRTALMKSADVLAVPSLWPEPFGVVGVQAAFVGLPAVAYAIGGISDWLEPGVTGEFAPGDRPTVAGFADALVRALRDPEHLVHLRVGAWKSAHRHTMKAHLAALEPHLASAAAATGARRNQ